MLEAWRPAGADGAQRSAGHARPGAGRQPRPAPPAVGEPVAAVQPPPRPLHPGHADGDPRARPASSTATPRRRWAAWACWRRPPRPENSAGLRDAESLLSTCGCTSSCCWRRSFLWGWLVAGGGLSAGVAARLRRLPRLPVLGRDGVQLVLRPRRRPRRRPRASAPGRAGAAALFAGRAGAWAGCWRAFVNLPFWLAYGAFVVLSFAYSHPRIRLKAHTLAQPGRSSASARARWPFWPPGRPRAARSARPGASTARSARPRRCC